VKITIRLKKTLNFIKSLIRKELVVVKVSNEYKSNLVSLALKDILAVNQTSKMAFYTKVVKCKSLVLEKQQVKDFIESKKYIVYPNTLSVLESEKLRKKIGI
jgi:hypothetical protein